MKRILLALCILLHIGSALALGDGPLFPPPPPPQPYLNVLIQLVGGGSGTVTSSPEGIQCPPACTMTFQESTTTFVTLTAIPGPDSAFEGWNAIGCARNLECTVSVSTAVYVTATFISTITTTTIATDRNPSALGQAVTFTATVRNLTDTTGGLGTVTFSDGGTTLCDRVSLSLCSSESACARAQCTTQALPPGDRSIVAEYSGTSIFVATHSAPLVQTVAAGALPLNYTGLWWQPSEPGWGISFAHQGDVLFATLFTYDAAGNPMWLVMSRGNVQPDGKTFGGDLYRTSGLPFNSAAFTPGITKIGEMTVTFSTPERATLTYSYNGIIITKTIQPQVFGTRAANCFPTTLARTSLVNHQDLWWKSDEPGWGLSIAQQDNTIFAVLFTYNASGTPTWMVMPNGQRRPDGSWSGTLYRAMGSPFNALSVAPPSLASIGSMQLEFSSGTSAKLTVTFDGTTVIKSITREVFSSPLPACE